mmetsp:Transcript_15945/g.44112  ORF Transcript_15945/g.44112 Transcript_15945/m.44112 type:complete len:205 (-) Transcript_15945:239-853(-)
MISTTGLCSFACGTKQQPAVRILRLLLKCFHGREAAAATGGKSRVRSFFRGLEGPVELVHDLFAHRRHGLSFFAGHFLFVSHGVDFPVQGSQAILDLLEFLLVGLVGFVVSILARLLRQFPKAKKVPQQLACPPKVRVEPLFEIYRQRVDNFQCIGIGLGIELHAFGQRLQEQPTVRWRGKGIFELRSGARCGSSGVFCSVFLE